MREDEAVGVTEGAVRRSLATLDAIDVPPLASVRMRRSADAPLRGVAAITAAAFVVVLAVLAGDRLNAWRNDHSASGPTASAAIGVRLDERYGMLAQLPGVPQPGNGAASGVALVDELGHQLTPAFDGLLEAKTSPNGRYIALWLAGPEGNELKILDGVTRSIGPALLTTKERATRVNDILAWASDSSAVIVSTTADDTASTAGSIRANLRRVDLASGTVAAVMTYTTYTLAPLGWDRATGKVLVRAVTAPSGGKTLYLRVSDDGSAMVSTLVVDDSPVIANDAGTYVASVPSCTPGPCRTFVIHDAATYAVVSTIDLGSSAPLTTASGNWAILFRPRSSDVLVYFNRSLKGIFGIELYPDAGRGPRRDLGDLTVAPRSDGTITSPNGYFRADGSAVFYVHETDLTATSWSGDLIGIVSGGRSPATIPNPRAMVVLDPKLVALPPSGTSPITQISPRTAVADHIELPAEFSARRSLVSPDGSYVAAHGKADGIVRLYRIARTASSSVPQLVAVADVRGFSMAISWLEDSSAVLVQSDLVLGHDLQDHDRQPAWRIAIVNVDGRIVVAPSDASSFPSPLASLSPDGRWIPVSSDASPSIRLLSRDGLTVKTVVAAPVGDTYVGSAGWDANSDLLYVRASGDASTLVAIGTDGATRYTVPAPAGFGSVFWSPVARAVDRSWQLIAFTKGYGSDFREYRLLVGAELRPVPDELARSAPLGSAWPRGNELVYRTTAGTIRAYDVVAGTTRTLPLVVAPNMQPEIIGVIDHYYVWMELLRGYIGDIDTGQVVDVPLAQADYDRLNHGRLAVKRDDSIAILDLATWFGP